MGYNGVWIALGIMIRDAHPFFADLVAARLERAGPLPSNASTLAYRLYAKKGH
jgi:hypothetical protein